MVGAESHGTHAAGALAAADAGGAARVEDDHEGEQRAAGPGASGGGGAGGGAGAALRGGGTRGRVAERDDGQQPGAAVQSGRAWGAADRGRAWSAADVRRRSPRPDRGDGAAATGSEGGRDGDLVLEYPGADATSGGTLGGRGDDDSAGAARRGQLVPADADVVPDGHGAAQAQGRGGAGGRSEDGRKKGAIDRAYRLAEAAGIPLWCQDEAGPYQAIPHAGPSWQPRGQPARQPHEYVREGTTSLLTLFRPATGEVRAEPGVRPTNGVPHPWLKRELSALLARCPPVPPGAAAERRWGRWDRPAASHLLDAHRPPIRLIVVLDNRKGHHSHSLVPWCAERGIRSLHTP